MSEKIRLSDLKTEPSVMAFAPGLELGGRGCLAVDRGVLGAGAIMDSLVQVGELVFADRKFVAVHRAVLFSFESTRWAGLK